MRSAEELKGNYTGKNWDPFDKNNKIRSDYLVTDNVVKIIDEFITSRNNNNHKQLKAIDIGCGTGGLAIYMSTIGIDVTACDIIPEQIEKSKLHLKKITDDEKSINFYLGGIPDLSFLSKDTKYDLITSLFAHVYLDDNELMNSFKKIAQHLNKNGLGIIATNYQPRYIMLANEGKNLYSADKRIMPQFLNKDISFFDTLELIDRLLKEDGSVWETGKIYNHSPDLIINSICDAGLKIQRIILPRPSEEEKKMKVMQGCDVIPPYLIILYCI